MLSHLLPRSAPQPAGTLGRVLVVDDEHEIIEFIADLLQEHSYAVSSAVSVAEALKRIEQDQPNLVLLDLLMPLVNGQELLRIMRERNMLLRMPVIIITANRADPATLCAAGASAVIEKPFQIQELFKQIERYIRR